jgi:enamine deaminase RidA (YjgF/YER057c/UK114 family)
VKLQLINPESLGAPRGYSNGVLARGGAILFVAGQIGWNGDRQIVQGGFAAQFAQALSNALEVVREAGGTAENVARLTIYVAQKQEYLDALEEVGAAYRKLMGRHYPAMSLVEVSALLETGAKVEIEATAVVPAMRESTGDLPREGDAK